MQAMDVGVIEGVMVMQAMDVGVMDGASDGSWGKR